MTTGVRLAALSLLFSLARPAAARIAPPSAGKVPVKVGVFVTDLVGVDEVNETFRIRGYLYETWKDSRLAYRPRKGETARELDPARVWRPNVLMANADGALSVTGLNLRARPDGTVDSWEDFQGELTMQLMFRAFPFDSQTLPIVLQPFLDERDTISISPDMGQSGIGTQSWALLAQWGMRGMKAVAGQARLGQDGRFVVPELEFDMGIERQSDFYIWKIFLPLFIMAATAYCALWLRASDHAPQLSVALSALLTLIAFLFVIASSLPRVPYLTYIDAFFLITFLFAFLVLVELIALHQAILANKTARANALRRFSRWALPVVYLASNAAAAWIFLGR